ncbi:hypothetical protein AMECASPLE_013866 [Ameca splendens]|uniref:Uncharacterized protein n=1 Tax=Ameca splendens TaxID=208324 RepID=A0ABV0YPL8_9TELE
MFALACHAAIIVTVTQTETAVGRSNWKRFLSKEAEVEETLWPISRTSGYYKKAAQLMVASHITLISLFFLCGPMYFIFVFCKFPKVHLNLCQAGVIDLHLFEYDWKADT